MDELKKTGSRSARCRRILRRIAIALLAVVVGCGVGVLALAPGRGPPILACLTPEADVLAYAVDIDDLWAALDSSERFREFRSGPAWRRLAESEPGRALGDALASAGRSGVRLTRRRASHLVGREVGAAVRLDAAAGAVTDWLIAFRIDTWARTAELAAGRLFLADRVSRREENGTTLAVLDTGSGRVYWARLGDVLLVAGSGDFLGRAVEAARAPDGSREWGADAAERFETEGLGERGPGTGFRAAVRVRKATPMLAGALGTGTDGPGLARLAEMLRSAGLPGKIETVSVAVRTKGSRVYEETFLRGDFPRPEGATAARRPPPAGAYAVWRFVPGKAEASASLWRSLRAVSPPGSRTTPGERRQLAASGQDVFRSIIEPRIGSGLEMVVAAQEIQSSLGGFPAQFAFFQVAGAGDLAAPMEELFAARSLGVYDEGAAQPTFYPYLVRHRAGQTPVYEMVTLNTHSHEGYRPSFALRADEMIYCSSLEALRSFLGTTGGAGGTEAEPVDAWLAIEGDEVLRLDWRAPRDMRQLGNAYAFFAEMRFATTDSAASLEDTADTEALWAPYEDLLRHVARQERLGVAAPDGMRMRAVWSLGN